MMMLWAWAGVPLGVYNIVEDFNIALRIQPQILTLLSLVTWIQCFYYEKVSLHPCSLVTPLHGLELSTTTYIELVRHSLSTRCSCGVYYGRDTDGSDFCTACCEG